MKPRSFTLRVVLLLAACVAAAGMTRSQERSLTTEQLAAGADLVVVGKVTGQRSFWTPDRKRIVTNIAITVDEQLKGTPQGSTVTVVVPGGEVDGVGEWYSHTARFMRNEEVVVFARRDKEGALRVAGGSQGKLTVTRDPERGSARVAGSRSLEELRAEVRKAAGIQQAPTDR